MPQGASQKYRSDLLQNIGDTSPAEPKPLGFAILQSGKQEIVRTRHTTAAAAALLFGS
jgi:hypothetical protein